MEGKIRHGKHPILGGMGNVIVDQDAAGNIKPNKKKSTENRRCGRADHGTWGQLGGSITTVSMMKGVVIYGHILRVVPLTGWPKNRVGGGWNFLFVHNR